MWMYSKQKESSLVDKESFPSKQKERTLVNKRKALYDQTKTLFKQSYPNKWMSSKRKESSLVHERKAFPSKQKESPLVNKRKALHDQPKIYQICECLINKRKAH